MRGHASFLNRIALAALDGVLIVCSLVVAYLLRFESGWIAAPLGVPSFAAYLPSILFALFLAIIFFDAHGLYGDRPRLGRLDESLRVFRATSLVFLALMAASFFYRGVSFSRLWFGLAWGLSVVALVSGRLAMRAFETDRYRRGIGVRRVAIAGTGDTARIIHERLGKHPALGLVPVGFLRLGSDPDLGSQRVAPLPAPVLGAARDLSVIALRHDIKILVVTDLPRGREEALELITLSQGAGVECRLVPDLFALMTSGAPVLEFDGIPLIALRGRAFRTSDRVVKRTTDIVLASFALFFFAPLIAALALAVKLEGDGPVFFRQRRVGRDGRVFTMYKFRSMRPDAEAASGPTWAHEDDPRSTRLGSILRRASLDEIPQLWNVLRGEMSLVGPRPEQEPFVRLFGERIPRYLERLRVKSGVTGWAQVNGLRGNTSIEARTMHDIYYVENWSLAFDLKILLLTLGHLVSRVRTPSRGGEMELETERVLREDPAVRIKGQGTGGRDEVRASGSTMP